MRAARNYPTRNRRADASDTRIGDLLSQARQKRSWASFAEAHGRKGEAKIHRNAARSLEKSLRTLGYTGEV